MIKTSLIISTYNWPEALELCLKSVAVQKVLPDEIIIADDGSGDETKSVIQQFSSLIKVPVKHVWQEDEGFRLARIRNLAIKNAECDYLIFIDGDIIIHPDFIHDHYENRKVERFIAGSRVLLSEKESIRRFQSKQIIFNFPFFNAKNRLNGIRNSYLSKIISKYDYGIYNVRGCNMAFWKRDLYEVNGFDERFVGWGREDSDIVNRLILAGKKKFKLKFSAIQYHLYHKEHDRGSVDRNTDLLDKSISEQNIKAKIGLDKLK